MASAEDAEAGTPHSSIVGVGSIVQAQVGEWQRTGTQAQTTDTDQPTQTQHPRRDETT
jgi:hypothetical protein